MSFSLFADSSSKMLEEWNKLSEDEQWLCLLSEPLMEQNKLSITTVNPERYVPFGSKSVSRFILGDSWNLYTKSDVLQILNDYRLKRIGHGATFNKLSEQLKQTQQNSVKQLAIKECMESVVIARAYYVAEMQDVLGEYGLLAWDYGRMLSIIRWSIAAGWLTEKEALELAKPFIDELINAYDSWEDYAVHYALGRVFYAFSDGKDYNVYLNSIINCIKKYDIEVSEDQKDKVFTYHNTKFPAKNQHNNRILTYKDAVYKPSKDAASWILAVKTEKNFIYGIDSKEQKILNNFLAENRDIPAAVYLEARLFQKDEAERLEKEIEYYENKTTKSKWEKMKSLHHESAMAILDAFNKASLAFENVEVQDDLYYNFYFEYALVANEAGDLRKVDLAVSKFIEEKSDSLDCQNLFCIYYTNKAKECTSLGEYEAGIEYAKKGLACYEKGKDLYDAEAIYKKRASVYEKDLNMIIAESAPEQMIYSWNKLSEDEKWFCLLSEPSIEFRSLSVATVNPEKCVSYPVSVSKNYLEKYWNITSRKDALDIVEKYRLKQAGQNVSFDESKAKLNLNNQSTIEQIAIKECLDSFTIARLYLINDLQNVLGGYELLAWDYGQILGVLRMCIATGLFSEEEALNLARPFIDELINAYDSWEDYAVHYAIGQIFNSFSEKRDYKSQQKKVIESIEKYDIEVADAEKDRVFSFSDMKFIGNKRFDNRILTYEDADYKLSNNLDCWMSIVEIENKGETTFNSFVETSFMNTFFKENLNIPAVANFWLDYKIDKKTVGYSIRYGMRYLFRHGFSGNTFEEDEIFYNKEEEKRFYKKFAKNLLTRYNKASPAFENVEIKNETYFEFFRSYAYVAYHAGDMKKMDFAASRLDEEICQKSEYYDVYCPYYINKAKECVARNEYEAAVEFAEKALYYLEIIEKNPQKQTMTLTIDTDDCKKDLNKILKNAKKN